MLKKLQYFICSRRGHGNIEKSGDMETWRHGHGHKKTCVIIIGTQKIGLNWHVPLWKITEIQKSIKLLISEFWWIPRNLIPSPTEVLKYGTEVKQFRRNSVPTEFRGHPFEFSRCLVFKYGFFNLQIIVQIRRFYAFLSTNI